MDNINSKTALDIVEELNSNVEERGGLEYYRPFEFRTVGYMTSAIYFMGIVIWTEENDERDYIGETDEKEPLREFIIKQAERILKDLNMKMGAF